MRGDVGFRSTPEVGSEFWVDIPAQTTELISERPKRLAERHMSRSESQEHKLVLYVEDNPANVAFMRDLVSTFDQIDLITAPSAELGIELARARRPAVVIMDINLPGMSGIDALRVLQQHPETATVPVIALTAAASERDKARGTQAGFFRYLTKPVKVDEFIAALETLLQQGR